MKTKAVKAIEANRQLELLKKYYEIDDVNKLITISLHYEKMHELLAEEVVGIKQKFSLDVISRISQIIENVPFEYKVNIEFIVCDYENYNPKEVLDAFNDTIELTQYSAKIKRQKKELGASILILTGILLLCFASIGKSLGWFGNGIKLDITSEIIDIAAWVFVWEAVTMIFLEHPDEFKYAIQFKNRVMLVIMKNDNKELIYEEKAANIFGGWFNERKARRVSKILLLISSMAFIFSAFSIFYKVVYKLVYQSEGVLVDTIFAIMGIIIMILSVLAGLAGISKYRERNGVIEGFVGPIAIFFTSLFVLYIVVAIIKRPADFNSLALISGFTMQIMYASGYYLDKITKK